MSTAKQVFLLTAAMAISALAEKQPYSRYQSIVDRQMFGALPAGFDPTKLPSEVTKASQRELTKEQEQLKSAIRFSVINLTPDGQVAVGFTDSSDGKNPRHYYLKVGESRGGWLVKEADPETATMTIAKGEIEVTLTIGGDSAKDAAATAKAGAAKANDGIMLLNAPTARSPLLGGTLRSRRRAKLAAEQEQENARLRQREEERQAREAEREEQKRQLQEMRDDLKAQLESVRQDMIEKAKAENAAAERGAQEQVEHENNDAE